MADAGDSLLKLLEGSVNPELVERIRLNRQGGSARRIDALPADLSKSHSVASSPCPETDAGSPSPQLATPESASKGGKRKLTSQGQSTSSSKRVKAVSANGRKVFQPSGNLKLRSDHPVRADQLPDIWNNILSFCPPKFLRTAWQINRDVYLVLKAQSFIWRNSRYNHYGHDMPNPPPSIDERALNTLLEGTKCQSCGTETLTKSRTVYWNFPARLCASCFANDTFKMDHNFLSELGHPILGISGALGSQAWNVLKKCIPHAVKSAGSYKGSFLDQEPTALQFRRSTRHYSKSEIAKFKTAFLEFVEVEADDPRLPKWTGTPADDETPISPGTKSANEIKEWGEARARQATTEFEPLRKLETFMEERRLAKAEHNKEVKKARVEFFIQRAAESNPAISPEDLTKSPAYHRSIVITRPHSEDCWKKLEAKIREEQQNVRADEPTKRWSNRSFYSQLPINYINEARAKAASTPTSESAAQTSNQGPFDNGIWGLHHYSSLNTNPLYLWDYNYYAHLPRPNLPPHPPQPPPM